MEREILIQSPQSVGPNKSQMSQTHPQWKFLVGKLVHLHSLPLSVSLNLSLFVCMSVSLLVSLSTAEWYLPFVTAADAKVLEHSGKLQLLLEILHWAEELEDKV